MQYRTISGTDLKVSELTFGCMLFGEGNDLAESHQLLNICKDHGVNAYDVAEMYPVPQRAETSGRSEEYLGKWLKTQDRDKVVVMTKVAGPSGQMTWIRGGPHSLDARNVTEAIEGSLRRLGTDYIDLLQIHWPDRYVPMFGDLDYNPEYAFQSVPLEETLGAVGRAIEQGKVRHLGLSNETPYGVMESLRLWKQGKTPRPVSIQNAYNLLCRTFDAGLCEICHLEDISLLPYSPLAMGLLTGKYTDDLPPDHIQQAARALAETLLTLAPSPSSSSSSATPSAPCLAYGGPPEARLNRYRGRYAEAESRYGPRPPVVAAVAAYCAVARRHGMSPTELALRFALGHPRTASVVFGASTVEQLRECLATAGQDPLPAEVREEVDRIHALIPNPTP